MGDKKTIRVNGNIWTGDSNGLITSPEGGVGDLIQAFASGGISAFVYKETYYGRG